MFEIYSRIELIEFWLDKNIYSLFIKIEISAAEAMEIHNIIPKGVVKKIKAKSKIDVEKILKIEGKVRHGVIAFLTSLIEKVGKEASYLHKGMTSSDVLDTCFNIQLRESGLIILK